MAETLDRIAEIKTEVEKLLAHIQDVQPSLLRASVELRVLQDLREVAKWVDGLR